MDLTRGLEDLVAVALVAALAPLVIAVLPGPPIPQVAIFLFGGVLIGPQGLGLAETANIQLLSNIGLGFLFLLAGYELDPLLLRQHAARLAILGWLTSAAIAVGVVAGLGAAGYVKDYVPVGLALTTTALGVLLPILRDNSMLGGEFGRHVRAAGTVGELFPILVIAVFLTQRGHFVALASVALVGVLALGLSAVPRLARNSAVQRTIREGQDATGQTTLRWALVLLFLLLAIASRFGLDVVLGAMLAGMVLRRWTRRMEVDTTGLEHKFDAVGYGIFIPIFFVASGMMLDLHALTQDPLRLLTFFVLLLLVRGLPTLFVYRRRLPARQRLEMTFLTATTMPLLVALADIGERDGVMLPATAAALIGAGALSVLVYPLIAVALRRSAPLATAMAATKKPETGTGLARRSRNPASAVAAGLHQPCLGLQHSVRVRALRTALAIASTGDRTHKSVGVTRASAPLRFPALFSPGWMGRSVRIGRMCSFIRVRTRFWMLPAPGTSVAHSAQPGRGGIWQLLSFIGPRSSAAILTGSRYARGSR